jgi:hypothetical protein
MEIDGAGKVTGISAQRSQIACGVDGCSLRRCHIDMAILNSSH